MKVDALSELTGATVLSCDGEPIGELAAVHASGSSDLLFVEIEDGRKASRLLVPAFEARIRDRLVVAYRAADVRRGPVLFAGQALSVSLVNEVLSYYAPLAEDQPEEPPAQDPPAQYPSEPPPGKGEDRPYKRKNLPPPVHYVQPTVELFFGGSMNVRPWETTFRTQKPFEVDG
jgi:hypothetical protein